MLLLRQRRYSLHHFREAHILRGRRRVWHPGIGFQYRVFGGRTIPLMCERFSRMDHTKDGQCMSWLTTAWSGPPGVHAKGVNELGDENTSSSFGAAATRMTR